MAINLVIAVTDGDWFEMLRWQQDLFIRSGLLLFDAVW